MIGPVMEKWRFGWTIRCCGETLHFFRWSRAALQFARLVRSHPVEGF